MKKVIYNSPLGRMLLTAEEGGLSGVWFLGQKYFPSNLQAEPGEGDQILLETHSWLDEYFLGREPDFMPPLHLVGTEYQKAVWNTLLTIPYGKTRTYGSIAEELSGTVRCAQAVGSAVGKNKISILIPCHRVVGASGSLTGYAGGLERKAALLRLERVLL